MVSFRVFAKLQLRLNPQPSLPALELFSLPSVQPLCFQSVTHSSTQRAQHIFFSFNHFRTLFIATEGVGVLPTFQPSNLQTCQLSHQLSPFRSFTYKMPLAQLLYFDN